MSEYWAYYGNTSDGAEQGVYVQSLDVSSFEAGAVRRVADAAFAGFQVIDPDERFLYSIDLKEGMGWVQSYAIDGATGGLSLVNEGKAAGGKLCYLGLDRSAQWVLGASYADAVVTIFPVNGGGSLGDATFSMQRFEGSEVVAGRQAEAHAHSIYTDPTNQYIFICDLGSDEILVGKFDSKKGLVDLDSIVSVPTVPGAGPRHLAFHPNGKWVFVINELNGSISSYHWEASTGSLSLIDTVTTLPSDFVGKNTTAEIISSTDGRFVYGSNRGHDSLVVYEICPDSGRLNLIQTESTRGGHPRHFNISPCGQTLLVANRDSDSIESFRIDRKSGKLEYVKRLAKVPTPTCVRFVVKE